MAAGEWEVRRGEEGKKERRGFRVAPSLWVRMAAWVLASMGAVNLVEAFLPKDPAVLDWMEEWIPFSISAHSKYLLFPSGLALIFLARGLHRRKQMAWVVAMGVLSVSIILHLCHAFDWPHSVFAAGVVVLLWCRKGEFVAQSDRASIRTGLWVWLLLVCGTIVYGASGLRDFRKRGEVVLQEQGENWLVDLRVAGEAVFLQRVEGIKVQSDRAELFLHMIRGFGIVGGLAGLVFLLRPVLSGRKEALTVEKEREYRSLVRRYGDDPMNEFLFAPDKSLFFDSATESLTGYALWRNFAVVLADPVCPTEKRTDATRAFLDFCIRNDWEPLFYCVAAERRQVYEELGLVTWKIAEDARIRVEGFELKGGKFQNLRTACNRALREGYRVVWYEPEGEGGRIDEGLERQMQEISDGWLAKKHIAEMGFDVGRFDLRQIRRVGASVVVSPEGEVVAFATWLPYGWEGGENPKGRALDLMRSKPDVKNIMDFLIVQTIDHFRSQGVEEISLGNAPLANVEEDLSGFRREERAVRFLFENFNTFYGYKSLFYFKQKYQPSWKGRYVAYRPGLNLLLMATALVAVHFPDGVLGVMRS
ncbi:MAG: phosphatidylglycerol lysyltransferase domain-containing protein [Chthoniobacterales bacterium]|nr:phosphatidylglycerol lysyltransferase domain-containing protein [Chthoniobacterales bacterium]